MRGFVKFCIQRPVFTGCSVIIWLLLGISSYLGLGVQPPMSSWGQMISAAQPYIQTCTYYSIIPGVAIIITVMAFNLLGDALRDALDPKMRS